MRTRELELDFIRVISMFMIIFCHVSAEAGMKWGEYFNVGVMIFMFMSGYLSYRTDYSRKWMKDRLKRILPEYYIFVIVYLLVTAFFFHTRYTAKQVLINFFVLQGLFTESGIPNILHLWFVTYILICYLLTPVAVRFLRNTNWKKLVLSALIFQVAVIPFRIVGIRIVFSRFVAYFLGLYMAMNQGDENKESHYKEISLKMAMPVVLINAIRFMLELSGKQDRLPGYWGMALGLAWQWAHMFLGIFLFFLLWCVGHKLMEIFSERQKKIIVSLSAGSYCVYIVHQVFVYHEYAITRYISPYPIGMVVALFCIAASTYALYYISNSFRALLSRNKK